MVDLRVMNNVISQYSKMFVSLGFFFFFFTLHHSMRFSSFLRDESRMEWWEIGLETKI